MPSRDPCRSETGANDAAPGSERIPRGALSRMLWGIDWGEHLPVAIGSGFAAHASTYDQALPFVLEHYAAIFREESDSPFSTRTSPQKERYYRFAGDFFEFKAGETTIGLLVGAPVDWSTYYIRTAATLPAYQGKKIIQRFFPAMFDLLRRAGVERVEADTSPSNMATLHLLTRLRFNPTGTILSDRWGAHVHFTRFLDDRSEDVFVQRFCTGIPYQLRERAQRRAVSDGLEGR